MFLSDMMQIFGKMGWANRITMMRIGAVLPILLLIHFPNVYTCWIAMILFVAAAVTDFLDGYIARREKQVTNYGKWKTVFQIIAMVPLLIHFPILGLPVHLIGTVVLYIALVLTIFSGCNYFYLFYRQWRDHLADNN